MQKEKSLAVSQKTTCQSIPNKRMPRGRQSSGKDGEQANVASSPLVDAEPRPQSFWIIKLRF